VWLDCTELDLNDKELRQFMIDAGVGLLDGPEFGPGGSGFQRINIATQRSVLEEALERIEKAVDIL